MHVLLDGAGRLVRRILRRLPARLRVRRGLTISTRKRRHSSRPSSEASAVFDVRGGPELGHEGLHGSSAGVVAQKVPYLVSEHSGAILPTKPWDSEERQEQFALRHARVLQKILTMDSMQSSTAADVEAGETYLSVMEKNLEVLREALQ